MIFTEVYIFRDILLLDQLAPLPASATAKPSVMGYGDLLPLNWMHSKKTSVMIFSQKTSIVTASSFLKGRSRFVLSQTLGSCILALALTIVIMLMTT
ncbi:hypothetical protein IGI04_029298 [Brassica rapa subsp. trilocularis]|uniref:Uncharacterized protein n=1 Tax=Brassica rapa subsp. trilocularis TaxID=1813537 RepID=A0ABQ7LMJ2_BRACM|nr:hypothetical protein IGI04_029298 [Brassica rapa subsp. trilocularis]